jgi:chorismate mutase/prephenate dehydratase
MKSDNKLEELRSKLYLLDNDLLKLLSARREISAQVAEFKSEEPNVPLRDYNKEEELLLRQLKQARELGLESHFIAKLFNLILQDSRKIQQDYFINKDNLELRKLERIAYVGGPGTEAYVAVNQYINKKSDKLALVECRNFHDLIKLVESAEVQQGIMPIENTSSGGINEVYDLLQNTDLYIIGEEQYQSDSALVALKNTSLNQIKTIICSVSSLSECSKFIHSLTNVRIECNNNLEQVTNIIKANNDSSTAIITSTEAATVLGLNPIQTNIANHKENNTRYIVVSNKPIEVDSRISAKVSLVLATANEPGSLVQVLSIFRENSVNLTKLESRPIIGNPYEELFYLDLDGNLKDDKIKETIDEVTKRSRFLKVLGCYPKAVSSPTNVKLESEKLTVSKNVNIITSKSTNSTETKVSIPKAYKLASREYKSENTIIDVKGVKIGDGNFIIMAGPCSVENYEQIMSCAKEAKEAGALFLRGGCFKPRTNPYAFQGLGLEGLAMLKEAGDQYDLPIVTEVMTTEDVKEVAKYSDILQIGARNMQNFNLLREVGNTHRPVLLKRGMSASILELLQATEYILAQGNQQVILCERGIRTFETATRSTLDLSAIPVLKQKTHLPIIVDPSHAAGERSLVPPLAYAAKGVGADGIIVEFHPNPEVALSDGPQALYFDQFREMTSKLLA